MSADPQIIELDCAPFMPRPGDLLPSIVKDTCLEAFAIRKPISMLFGNWTWDFSDVPADCWAAVKPVLRERITALYNEGRIRYGSW